MSYPIPPKHREKVVGSFSRFVNADISEAKEDNFGSYSTLNEFFTRELKDGSRPLQTSRLGHQVWCPSDGKVLQFGPVNTFNSELPEKQKEVAVKGEKFSLCEFLGPMSITDKLSGEIQTRTCYSASDLLKKKKGNSCLYVCTIYLSPKDCHRFYSPVKWYAKVARHFTGSLLSVRPGILNFFCWPQLKRQQKKSSQTEAVVDSDRLSPVLSLQERCVLIGEWKQGFFAFAPVGATAVGSISINQCPQIKTNAEGMKGKFVNKLREWSVQKHHQIFQDYKLSGSAGNRTKGVEIGIQEEIGKFNLGSTIVLIFEAPVGLQIVHAPSTETSSALNNSCRIGTCMIK